MARVQPFRGLQFNRGVVQDLARVLCPPYDVIGPQQQVALRALSPYNVVRLELPADAEGQPGSRYAQAARTLADWKASGALEPAPVPTYYLHRTRFTLGSQRVERRDLLAALGVDPWEAGTVLPHEHTMAGPKADRLALLRATHANVSPIWVLHRDLPDALRRAWDDAEQTQAAFQAALDGEEHDLWQVDDAALLAQIEGAFAAGGPLYIADGHHRYETTLAFRREADTAIPGATATLAVVTWAGDPGLVVLPTHRVLRGLRQPSDPATLQQRWADTLRVQWHELPDGVAPERLTSLLGEMQQMGAERPTFGVLAGSAFGLLRVEDVSAAQARLPADHSAAWKALDVALLHGLVVDPLLEAVDLPRDEALTYVRDATDAVEAVRSGSAAMAFFLNPTRVEQVLAVADAGDRMPEKSTYFHPKPPTGLVIRDLDLAR